jgi:hypothetical protein
MMRRMMKVVHCQILHNSGFFKNHLPYSKELYQIVILDARGIYKLNI